LGCFEGCDSCCLDAYRKADKPKPEPKKEKKGEKLKSKILSAGNSKELENAIDEIITSGYTVEPWGVGKKPKEDLKKWILENYLKEDQILIRDAIEYFLR
jgi:peptidyl-tRNA hydrolase